jgi:CubicO group peptidase (beta-lactamase class C family)
MRARSLLAVLSLAASTAGAQSASALPDSLARRVDRIFAAFNRETPGCGVAIGRDSRPAYIRGYGMANLEYDVPLDEQTVFESGSVAKQFTSAAIVLLALDGKLTLEDDIRKHLPEVPAFPGGPITIRMLLTHTSGLRDQWGLLGIRGEGPGQRVHSPATTLDLVTHQKMLNFPPGTDYLYSNTGYALAGLIVERVSGKSLDAFSQERLFKPLGMSSTQWRDDFNEVVKRRATAYGGRGGNVRTNMPFTNMIGNGGLLFSLGDVLTWMANLDNPVVGGAAWRDSLHTRGRLKNGRTLPYALGLIHGTFNGAAEVSHGGSTAGYQTWIGRYPEHRLSIAVLCNVTTAGPVELAHQVASIFLPPRTAAATATAQQGGAAPITLTATELSRWPGIYRQPATDQVIRLSVRDGTVRVGNQATGLTATSATRLRGASAEYALTVGQRMRRLAVVNGGDTTEYEAVPPADTSAKALAEYVGSYVSDELETKVAVAMRDGRLVLLRRPSAAGPMQPIYKDDFSSSTLGGTVRFTRDRAGKVTGFSVFAGRIRDVRFRKVSAASGL